MATVYAVLGNFINLPKLTHTSQLYCCWCKKGWELTFKCVCACVGVCVWVGNDGLNRVNFKKVDKTTS
jgi:hypothetical protein